MKKLILALSLLLSIHAFAKGPLDGTTARGKLGPDADQETKYKDDLIFKDGTFISTACESQGFGPAAYEAKLEGKTKTFVVDTQNSKGEKLHWTGTIKGKKVECTVLSTKADGKTENWTYKGTLVSKK